MKLFDIASPVKGFSFALSLALLVSSSAIPTKEAASTVQANEANSTVPAKEATSIDAKTLASQNATVNALPGNGADCSMYWDYDESPNGYTGFNLHLWGQWAQDGGKGFQDNVKGQCGGYINWNWETWNDGSGHVNMLVAHENPNVCVQNAVWLASNPSGAIWGMKCCWDTYPWCDFLR